MHGHGSCGISQIAQTGGEKMTENEHKWQMIFPCYIFNMNWPCDFGSNSNVRTLINSQECWVLMRNVCLCHWKRKRSIKEIKCMDGTLKDNRHHYANIRLHFNKRKFPWNKIQSVENKSHYFAKKSKKVKIPYCYLSQKIFLIFAHNIHLKNVSKP